MHSLQLMSEELMSASLSGDICMSYLEVYSMEDLFLTLIHLLIHSLIHLCQFPLMDFFF